MDYILIREAIENRANLNMGCPRSECKSNHLYADIQYSKEVWVCSDCETIFNKEYLVGALNQHIKNENYQMDSRSILAKEESAQGVDTLNANDFIRNDCCIPKPKEKKAKNMNKSMMKKMMMMSMMGQGGAGMANNLLPMMMMSDDDSDDDSKSSMMMLMMMQTNAQQSATGTADHVSYAAHDDDG